MPWVSAVPRAAAIRHRATFFIRFRLCVCFCLSLSFLSSYRQHCVAPFGVGGGWQPGARREIPRLQLFAGIRLVTTLHSSPLAHSHFLFPLVVLFFLQSTGTRITVYSVCCPRSTDRIVQILGKPSDCAECIKQIVALVKEVNITHMTLIISHF